MRREGVLPFKKRSGSKKSASLPAAAQAADPLDPNKSLAAAAPLSPPPAIGSADATALAAAPVAARRSSATGQKHIHFEQSDKDDDSEREEEEEEEENEEQLSNAEAAAIARSSPPPAAQPARVSKAPVQAALLPAPDAAVSVALPRAASSNGTTPAPRADTLAQVFAARGHATAAHASGRSSPQVAAGGPAHQADALLQQEAANQWRQKLRSVREPQVVHDLLPMVQRKVQPGDVISYKLLEISADFSPQVRSRQVEFDMTHPAQVLAPPSRTPKVQTKTLSKSW